MGHPAMEIPAPRRVPARAHDHDGPPFRHDADPTAR